MWLEAGLFRLAEEFWEGVPLPCRALPRDLAAVVSLALPVTVREVRDLTTRDVERRLHTYEVPYVPDSPCRRLRGCLIAYGGYGVILVDGADPGDQRRFTAAHEVAHFLVDYMEPRRRAIEALGRGIMPVLDGARPPTSTERLNAILGAVSLGLHLDIMERTGRGGYSSRSTLAS